MLSPADVRNLALAGRVTRSHRFHGDARGWPMRRIAYALGQAVRALPDRRTLPDGRLRHPHGWIVWCQHPPDVIVRVDLDLLEDQNGPLLAVVTAFEVDR